MTNKSDWIWMPHPGHFICSFYCKFHLNTCVGDFIVSTVGEFLIEQPIRGPFAKIRGVEMTHDMGEPQLYEYLQKVGYEDMEIGIGKKYQTMVFLAQDNKIDKKDIYMRNHIKCCPKIMLLSDGEFTYNSYKDCGSAYEGHIKLCEEFSKLTIEQAEKLYKSGDDNE